MMNDIIGIQAIFTEYLERDVENARTILNSLGTKTRAMNTPEKRALFMLGFENPGMNPRTILKSMGRTDSGSVARFVGWTDDDCFYMLMGQSAAYRRKER